MNFSRNSDCCYPLYQVISYVAKLRLIRMTPNRIVGVLFTTVLKPETCCVWRDYSKPFGQSLGNHNCYPYNFKQILFEPIKQKIHHIFICPNALQSMLQDILYSVCSWSWASVTLPAELAWIGCSKVAHLWIWEKMMRTSTIRLGVIQISLALVSRNANWQSEYECLRLWSLGWKVSLL